MVTPKRLDSRELAEVRFLADHAADPLDRLEALRRGYAHWASLEIDAVREARRSGCTWQAIADALQITRQSAHQRFAGALEKDT